MPLRLLGVGLPLTIVTGAMLGAAVVPSISLAEALVLAIVLACTDAALGQAVVSDERVPSRVRQGCLRWRACPSPSTACVPTGGVTTRPSPSPTPPSVRRPARPFTCIG